MTIKTFSRLFCVPLLFFTKTIFAQYSGIQQMQIQQMQRQGFQQAQKMNNRFIYNHYNPGMFIWSTWKFSREGNTSRIKGVGNDYTYIVVMKDSSRILVSSYIYMDTIQNKSYLLLVDKRYPKSDSTHRRVKIYSTQTLKISRDITPSDLPDSVKKRIWYDGMPTDSCWLFPVIKGRINLYSIFSETNDSDLFDPSTITAIQYGEGPIEKLKPETLKFAILNDEKAMKFFNKQNYLDAVKRYNKDEKKAEGDR